MEAGPDRLRSVVPALRVGLVVFVLAWFFGPYALRSTVPVWLPFLIALGLELHFFVTAGRPASAGARRRDRMPQLVDRERYGYLDDSEELLLVRRGDEEFWIPYSGEADPDVDALIAAAREEAERDARAPTGFVSDRRRRPVRQFLVGLGLIGALAAIVWAAETRGGWDGLDADTRAEAGSRFSAEASRLVGHPVTIRCDDAGDFVGAVQHADGVAAIGGRLAYLTPERCYHLYRLAFKGEVTFSQTARSLAVLAHEAWHLRGVRDEGTTECYALQSGVELGQRLGLSEQSARQMMRQQLAENALRRGASSEYVVSPGCYNGGSLDLDPGTSRFP
ncbi:MAG: hypothetical protein ACRDN6_04560 [Gaiellaceae bacterium]